MAQKPFPVNNDFYEALAIGNGDKWVVFQVGTVNGAGVAGRPLQSGAREFYQFRGTNTVALISATKGPPYKVQRMYKRFYREVTPLGVAGEWQENPSGKLFYWDSDHFEAGVKSYDRDYVAIRSFKEEKSPYQKIKLQDLTSKLAVSNNPSYISNSTPLEESARANESTRPSGNNNYLDFANPERGYGRNLDLAELEAINAAILNSPSAEDDRANAAARTIFQLALANQRLSPQELRSLVEQRLFREGYTLEEINRYLLTTNSSLGVSPNRTNSPSGGRQTGGGNAAPSSLPSIAPSQVPTRITVRAPFGYLAPPTTVADTRPQLLQTWVQPAQRGTPGVRATNRAKTEVFYFPYIPNNVTYSGLGSQWTEIPRGNSFPIVEWNSWNLLKVSMQFLVSSDRVDGTSVVPDGIYNNVSEQLNVLRRMAQRPFPVSVYGMDQLLSVAMRRAAETGAALEFVISDLQIQSLRRTFNAGDSEITAASVSLTLQEIPIESGQVALLSLPSITPTLLPSTAPTSSNSKEFNTLSGFSQVLVPKLEVGPVYSVIG